jgi:hypothetical protein
MSPLFRLLCLLFLAKKIFKLHEAIKYYLTPWTSALKVFLAGINFLL